MANKINIVISAEDKASAELKKTQQGLKNVSDGADDSSRASRALGAAADVAKVALIATGVAAVAAAKFAVTSAADYEQSLNIFKAVSGATAAEMVQVAARSRELGKDISLPGISAADAALAMVELGKAGLSVNDTMAASKGVLSLAKAGQLETAQAAEITANALNAFSLKGTEATRVADLLAAAANASSADVNDMAYALQMSSASAAAVKVPVEDLTTMIAEMANNGIKGSDAGTSLKTMFMNLIPTTKTAKAAMAELNLDFYDAKGNFVGVRAAIAQLEKGTAKLTDEQKALAIQTIFGSDSSRAANILLKEGVAGFDKMSAAVNKQGSAADLAAAQNAGFKGALDALQSSIETVAIDVGMKMLPTLTSFATTLGNNVEPAFESLKGTIKTVWPVIQDIAMQVGDYLNPKLFWLWNTIEGSLVPAMTNLMTALAPLAPVIGTVVVVAIGILIEVLDKSVWLFSKLVEGTAWVIKAFQDGNPFVVLLTGAFAGLAAAMTFNAIFNALSVGFATMTLVTIPSVMTSVGLLQGMILAPMVMPAIAVGAALFSLGLVIAKALEAADAIRGAQDAKNSEAKQTVADQQHFLQIAKNPVKYGPDAADKAKRYLKTTGYPGYAIGTGYSRGGSTLVGENGPEIVNMPQGARVTQAYRTRNELGNGGGGGVNVTITGPVSFNDRSDIDYFAQRINQAQRLARSGMGGTVGAAA